MGTNDVLLYFYVKIRLYSLKEIHYKIFFFLQKAEVRHFQQNNLYFRSYFCFLKQEKMFFQCKQVYFAFQKHFFSLISVLTLLQSYIFSKNDQINCVLSTLADKEDIQQGFADFTIRVIALFLVQLQFYSINSLKEVIREICMIIYKQSEPSTLKLNIMTKLQNFKDIQLINNSKKTILIEEEEIDTSAISQKSSQSEASSPKKKFGKRKKYNSLKKDEENDQESPPESDQKGQNSKKPKKVQKNNKFSWPIFKRFFVYTRKRWFLASISLILSILYAVSVSILPLKVGNVLDYITKVDDQNQKTVSVLNNGIQELSIIVLCLAIFTYLRFVSMQFLQQVLSIDMRLDIFSKFIKNDMYFFQKYKSGELVSRLNEDLNQAKSAVSNNLAFFIRSIVIVISNIIILFTLSWKLTLLVMLVVPVYMIITRWYSKRNKILIRAYQDVKAELSANVVQKFMGIQIVKAYATEDLQIQKYNAIMDKGYKIQTKRIIIQGIYQSCSDFLPYIGILIVLWYGGKLIIDGGSDLSPGSLTSFIMYCSSLANSTSNISNSYTNIINGTHAVQKVFEMLDYEPLVKEDQGQNKVIHGEIQLKNVKFAYPTSKVSIFQDLSLKIKQGQYIAFVGESGSGKSTIVKLIQKLYKISQGQILFDQNNSDEINVRNLRKQIGFVNQDATLFSGTIEQNITYGLDNYTLVELYEAANKSGCLQFLKNEANFPNCFQTQVGQKGSTLSGGQRQRISIARALIRKPKIIIFDEATSALDSNSQKMVQQSIQNLAACKPEDRVTIIVIAHRLSTVRKSDRIYVMKDGKIVESGNHKELTTNRGFYYSLVQKQLSDRHDGTIEVPSPVKIQQIDRDKFDEDREAQSPQKIAN